MASAERIAPYLSTTTKSISVCVSSQSSGSGDDRVPLPKQWTLVNECYMERREPFEIFRSGVKHQIANIGRKLSQSLVEFTDLNSIMPPESDSGDDDEPKEAPASSNGSPNSPRTKT